MEISKSNPLATATIAAIHAGDLDALNQLLRDHPGLAAARFIDQKGVGRTPLHVVTDWPGHFPNCARTIALLLSAGADPNTAVSGTDKHAETPLHWAASSDDVEALDALLDGGANIEQPGAIFTGGPAMSDAVIFAQWKAARRLLERGAKTDFTQSAALGLQDRVEVLCTGQPTQELTAALWHACRGGQRPTAEFLLARGANLNWVGWDRLTPLDAARKSGNSELTDWLIRQGAKSAAELG